MDVVDQPPQDLDPQVESSPPTRNFWGRFAHRWYGPVITAVALGWLSSPLVAVWIVASSQAPLGRNYQGVVEPVGFGMALPMALVAVTAAALAGGSLGGLVVRRRRIAGLAIALLVAWPVAIATLPLLPALVAWPYRGAYFCLDACTPVLDGAAPLFSLGWYAESLFYSLFGPLEVAGILALVAIVLARRHHRALASAFVIAAFVAVNFVSISIGSIGAPWPPIALILGSIIWVAPYWHGHAGDETDSRERAGP